MSYKHRRKHSLSHTIEEMQIKIMISPNRTGRHEGLGAWKSLCKLENCAPFWEEAPGDGDWGVLDLSPPSREPAPFKHTDSKHTIKHTKG